MLYIKTNTIEQCEAKLYNDEINFTRDVIIMENNSLFMSLSTKDGKKCKRIVQFFKLIRPKDVFKIAQVMLNNLPTHMFIKSSYLTHDPKHINIYDMYIKIITLCEKLRRINCKEYIPIVKEFSQLLISEINSYTRLPYQQVIEHIFKTKLYLSYKYFKIPQQFIKVGKNCHKKQEMPNKNQQKLFPRLFIKKQKIPDNRQRIKSLSPKYSKFNNIKKPFCTPLKTGLKKYKDVISLSPKYSTFNNIKKPFCTPLKTAPEKYKDVISLPHRYSKFDNIKKPFCTPLKTALKKYKDVYTTTDNTVKNINE